MRIRSLYLSIYLTVMAVVLVFALVAGLLLHWHADGEQARVEAVMAERTAAWASLLEANLPPVSADESLQGAALAEAARHLQIALALEAPDGRRIAATRLFSLLEERRDERRVLIIRVRFADGRALLVMPPRPPWEWGSGLSAFEDEEASSGPLRRPSDESARHSGWGGGAHGLGPHAPGGQASADQWLSFLPSSPMRRWFDRGLGGLARMAALLVAIAMGSYPVVRRLTRRLESLQRGVEAFGAGDLSYRVPAEGGDEVAAVAHSFNRAAQRIEDLVCANRSLLANASHELRSPLARLKMAMVMLETAPEDRRAALKAEIDQDIRELDALVEEVLLASRLDAQRELAQDPVDLPALVAEEAARLKAQAQVQVDVQSAALQAQIYGDERLLRRAVRNLLENARRYGGDEVMAEVRCEAAGPWLVVRVCDRGPGVPSSERERIFQPFYRLPGHSEQGGGVGLGLSLVRQIAETHGGRVHCEPREGGGSCFVLAVQAGPRA